MGKLNLSLVGRAWWEVLPQAVTHLGYSPVPPPHHPFLMWVSCTMVEQRELSLPCWTFCPIGSVHYSSTAKQYPTFLQPRSQEAYLAVYILPLLLLIYHYKCVPPFRFCTGCFTSQNRNSNLPEMKNVKYVSSLKRGFSNLAFTSTLHKCSWHKTEGSALLEMVLQMAVFQQTTY